MIAVRRRLTIAGSTRARPSSAPTYAAAAETAPCARPREAGFRLVARPSPAATLFAVTVAVWRARGFRRVAPAPDGHPGREDQDRDKTECEPAPAHDALPDRVPEVLEEPDDRGRRSDEERRAGRDERASLADAGVVVVARVRAESPDGRRDDESGERAEQRPEREPADELLQRRASREPVGRSDRRRASWRRGEWWTATCMATDLLP